LEVEFIKQIDLGNAPRSWNDLTRDQILFICNLFTKGKEENNFLAHVAMKVFDLKLLKVLQARGEKYFLFLHGRSRIILSPEQIASLGRKLSWLKEPSDLTRQKLPEIRIGFRKYYGPEDKLFNLTFAEYQTAENYYLAYNKLRDDQYLDMLVATLYRPQVKNFRKIRNTPAFKGDRREDFNDYLVDARAKKFKRLDKAKKFTIYQYFMGCMASLQKTYPLVFQELPGGSTSTDKIYNHTMLIEYLKGDDINADPLKENVYQIMARCQRDRLRQQFIENLKKNV
jgi:hypothetical protein